LWDGHREPGGNNRQVRHGIGNVKQGKKTEIRPVKTPKGALRAPMGGLPTAPEERIRAPTVRGGDQKRGPIHE